MFLDVTPKKLKHKTKADKTVNVYMNGLFGPFGFPFEMGEANHTQRGSRQEKVSRDDCYLK